MLLPCQPPTPARGVSDKEDTISQTLNTAIAVIGIDIRKNSFQPFDPIGNNPA